MAWAMFCGLMNNLRTQLKSLFSYSDHMEIYHHLWQRPPSICHFIKNFTTSEYQAIDHDMYKALYRQYF